MTPTFMLQQETAQTEEPAQELPMTAMLRLGHANSGLLGIFSDGSSPVDDAGIARGTTIFRAMVGGLADTLHGEIGEEFRKLFVLDEGVVLTAGELHMLTAAVHGWLNGAIAGAQADAAQAQMRAQMQAAAGQSYQASPNGGYGALAAGEPSSAYL